MAQPDLVPLSQLEHELGISRVDLLLLLRRLGLQPIRRGMRTLLNPEQVEQLVAHLGRGGPLEPITAELVFEEPDQETLPVPRAEGWGETVRYAQLRLLRERLDILEILMRSGIELDSRQLCDLLEVRRLPGVQPLEDGSVGFIRLGLQFTRQQRQGQRGSWRISRACRCGSGSC